MKKSFASKPKRAKAAAFASMNSKGKLYKRSCKTGKRRVQNGKVKAGEADYTAGTCSKKSHHGKVKAARRRLAENDKLSGLKKKGLKDEIKRKSQLKVGTKLQDKRNPKYKYIITAIKLVKAGHGPRNYDTYFYTLDKLAKGSHVVDGQKWNNSVGAISIYHEDLIKELEPISL